MSSAGGRMFDARPMEAKTVEYCVGDVVLMPALHAVYLRRIAVGWLSQVVLESSRRVDEAVFPSPRGRFRAKTVGSWSGRAAEGGAFGIFLGGWYLLVHWASVVSPRFGWLDMDGIVVLNTATIRSPTWTKLETFPLATHLSYCK